MSKWTFGDTTVSSGGKSSDPLLDGRLAEGLVEYSYGPAPASWPVEPTNDWCIHQWATQRARLDGVKLATDYKPNDSDMPTYVRAYLDECAKQKPTTSGPHPIH